MILLITSSASGETCAAALQSATGERTLVAPFPHRDSPWPGKIVESLSTVTTIVLDEAFVENQPAATELLLERTVCALPVFVNLAISGIPRVVRETQLALHRQHRERMQAMQAAEQLLRSEISSTLTGMLLGAQLALEVPGLPEAAKAKMRDVCMLAIETCERLDPSLRILPVKKKSRSSNAAVARVR